MGQVIDITDPSEPIALAREMVERAPECVAALAVLVRKDGSMWFDSRGHRKADVLWALSKMQMEILADE